jgi:hypothetical protein
MPCIEQNADIPNAFGEGIGMASDKLPRRRSNSAATGGEMTSQGDEVDAA